MPSPERSSGGKVAQDFAFVSLGKDVVVYVERLRAKDGFTPKSRETGVVGHEYPLGQNTRTLFGRFGRKEIVALGNPRTVHSLKTDWLNVGGKIGYVVRRGAGRANLMRYHDEAAGEGRVPKLQEWFSLVGDERPATLSGDMTQRDIVRAVLEGRRPPYVPWACAFTGGARRKLCDHHGSDDPHALAGNHVLFLNHALTRGAVNHFEDLGDDRAGSFRRGVESVRVQGGRRSVAALSWTTHVSRGPVDATPAADLSSGASSRESWWPPSCRRPGRLAGSRSFARPRLPTNCGGPCRPSRRLPSRRTAGDD